MTKNAYIWGGGMKIVFYVFYSKIRWEFHCFQFMNESWDQCFFKLGNFNRYRLQLAEFPILLYQRYYILHEHV